MTISGTLSPTVFVRRPEYKKWEEQFLDLSINYKMCVIPTWSEVLNKLLNPKPTSNCFYHYLIRCSTFLQFGALDLALGPRPRFLWKISGPKISFSILHVFISHFLSQIYF